MFRPEDFPLTTCSMLETFQESIPPWLTEEFNALKNRLRQSLLTEDFSLLESSIAAMQPMVFTLRLHATPFLTNFDFATELSKIETTFKNTPLLFPQLTDTVRQLSFGIHLMSNFIKNLDTQNVNFLTNTSAVINQDHAPVLPTLEQISQEILAEGSLEGQSILSLLHSSLTIELLVFAVDIITEEQLLLESGMYYELTYQSAVAVKTYAEFFEITENELPWYSPAENKFQQLLLEGPVLHGDDLQYLYEKREHLNLWRQSV